MNKLWVDSQIKNFYYIHKILIAFFLISILKLFKMNEFSFNLFSGWDFTVLCAISIAMYNSVSFLYNFSKHEKDIKSFKEYIYFINFSGALLEIFFLLNIIAAFFNLVHIANNELTFIYGIIFVFNVFNVIFWHISHTVLRKTGKFKYREYFNLIQL